MFPSSRQRRIACLVLTLVAALVAAMLAAPIPQDPAYHHFADARDLWRVPNFGNVMSNVPFAMVGTLAFAALATWVRRPPPGLRTRPEAVSFAVLFLGVFLTAFGSAYYHLPPSNARLVWDRLPMTIGLMGLLAFVIGERIGVRAGAWVLAPLLLVGVASVV